jgi:hypothetical protein
MRAMRRRTAIAVLAGFVGACSAFGPVPSAPEATNLRPTSSAEAAGSPKPREQRFEPPYPSARPVGELVRIQGPGLLSSDRRELTVQFIGGFGYRPGDPCSDDYTGWAEIENGVLEVAIVIIHHPDQATLAPDTACLAEGFSYLFHFDLASPFDGPTVRDLASGELWVPPPERVAFPSLLPAGWEAIDLRGSNFGDPGAHELYRTFLPPLTLAAPPRPFMTLVQTFGAASDRAEGTVVSKVLVHGNDVDLFRGPEPGELTVIWLLGGDGMTLQAFDQAMTIDQFVAIANAVRAPSAIPAALRTAGG